MRAIHALILVAAVAAGGTVAADERILAYDVDVEVQPDGAVVVTEDIAVRAEGKQIKRGIYRDFPTVYDARDGRRVRVGFDVLEVARDGEPENWFTKDLANGVRVYAGRENVRLDPGEHRYRFRYRTTRQLGFFEDHDELYWNVTGNGWSFPIDRASARVRLPGSVPGVDVRGEAYTGPQGAKGQDYEVDVDEEGALRFATTRALAPHEGLTIVATWPKGHLLEPTFGQRAAWFYEDNGAYAIVAAGIAVLLVYYWLAWSGFGRDPQAGVVIPLYEPPAGYSPASMRFVSRMGYDHQTFVAALVNLAVKGRVAIDEDGRSYSVDRANGGEDGLAPGESALLGRLFAGGSPLVLEQRNHARIRGALKAHERSLANDYEKLYFRRNRAFVVLGAALSVMTALAAALLRPGGIDERAMVLLFPCIVFGVMAATLVPRVVNALRGRSVVAVLPAVVAAVIMAIFAVGFFGQMPWNPHDLQLVWVVLALVAINVLFHYLMKAPTRRGRRLLDQIAGFREYLGVAEADELALKNPPEKTPELFERYLPYAIALGVEGAWGEKFARVLARAEREGTYREPSWYRGGRWSRSGGSGFASSLGSSLGASVASSSVAPGSSSGGGGGGSSGGGGGGGGGGGW